MPVMLKTMVSTCVAGILVCLGVPAAAQPDYPSKPIRFIVPFPPGSGTTVARFIGDKLTASWGQNVIVDSRPGGDTIIGADALAKSPRDGYTIMLIAPNHVNIPHLHQNVPFDALRDFEAVTTLTTAEQLLAVHPSLPVRNLKELISLARAKPNQLNFAGSGNGGPSHLAGEQFGLLAGVKIQHIAYKGSGPAVIDLIGGHVQLYFGPGILLIPHVKTGKLNVLAVSGSKRLPSLPQVPTFAEGGLPGFDARLWYGVLAPAGTPGAIIEKLAVEIGRILAMPEIAERLGNLGFEPFSSTPEQFAALMRADTARYGKIIKAANIKL